MIALLAALLFGLPVGPRPHFATQYNCPPYLTHPCEQVYARLKEGDGKDCFFVNYEGLLAGLDGIEYYQGGVGLDLVVTQLEGHGLYNVEWWNRLNRVIVIHAFTAVASYSCVDPG